MRIPLPLLASARTLAARGASRALALAALGLAALLLAPRAAALDPPQASGRLTSGGDTWELRHAMAWQPPQRDQLWIYLTDVELHLDDLRGHAAPLALARRGEVHGVRLVVNPREPRQRALRGDLLLPGIAPVVAADAAFQVLRFGDKRVVGTIADAAVAGARLSATFSTPVFGGLPPHLDLAGAQAARSEPADALLAYEEAVLDGGVAATLALRAPRAAQRTRALLDLAIGARTYERLRAATTDGLPRGDARRAQVSRVRVSGDDAVVTVDGRDVELQRIEERWLMK